MKLLPTYATSDAGNLVQDGYFDVETGTRYAVREGVRYVMSPATLKGSRAWSVVAYTGPGEDAVPMAHLSRDFETVEEALAELDRIAALIGGAAPDQGWAEGAPPKDGKWYVAIDRDGDPTVVRYDAGTNDITPWQTATHFRYANDPIYHQPTPIEAPKES